MANYDATSGSYTTRLTVTETGTDTATNTSTVNFSLTLIKNSGTGLWNNDSCSWSININGTSYSGTFTYDFRSYSSLTLKGSTNQTVTHNGDGTKSISVSASVNMDNTPYVYTMSPSGTLTLTTIPRASDVTVSNYSITNTSGSLSATITSKANFYHKWRWRMNSGTWSSWTNKGLISTTSSTVTVANTTLLAQLPTATSGSFNIEVATYSDSGYANHVGTKSATCTVSVNTTNIKPSVSLGNIGLNSTPISGYAVAGYSKVQSAWTTTNSSGATSVTTYFTVSTGSLATTSSSSTSGTVVSNVIPSNASNYTLTIYAYAKDSRGAVGATVNKSITVYGYQPPTANLSAYRTSSSSSTSEDGAGTYAYVTFSGAVRSSVNSQNSIQSTSCTYSGSISGTATNGGHYALADTQTVTFKLTVRDKVISSTASVTIATAQYPLDLYDDGNGNVGVGLGGLASSGYVFSPLHAFLAQQTDGVSYFSVGSPDKETGRTYSYFRAGGGTLYFGNGEKGSQWVGWLTAINQAGTSKELINVNQSLDVNFLGNATTATTATNAESVNNTLINPTSSTTYYVPFVTGTGYQTLHQNDGLRLLGQNGTASVEGYSVLTLGNGIANGTAGNKTGWLRLHAPTGYYAEITMASNASANRIIYFPNTSGTLAIHDTTLWTGKLLGGTSQAIDMSAYNRIRVYAMTWGVQHVFEIDLSESGKAVSGSGLTDTTWPWQGGSTVPHRDGAGTTGGHLTYYSVSCKVGSDKKSIWITSIGYQNIQSSYNAYVQALNNGQYYVYRVDGIL